MIDGKVKGHNKKLFVYEKHQDDWHLVCERCEEPIMMLAEGLRSSAVDAFEGDHRCPKALAS